VVRGNEPVYVVVMKGSFSAYVSGPTQTKLIHPRVLSIIADARTHRETDSGFSDRMPDLSRLGRVHDLLPYLLARSRASASR
ncbi:MAG: hypothetical protein WBB74_08490, partial [Gaiellaceae bacterium]